MNQSVVDVLVIGAGQAGLVAGYYLSNKGWNFLLIDQGGEIGEVWRNRYDSLQLFTPRWYSSLPGLKLDGSQEDVPSKDEIADYLQLYARTYDFPTHLQTKVTRLQKIKDVFTITTTDRIYLAKHVIIATGPFQKPFIPQFAQELSADVQQIHSAEYHNPSQIAEGNSLVIGAGNSGAQIAVELAQTKRNVTISTGHPLRYKPLKIAGKSIFWWLKKMGIVRMPKHSWIGKWLSKRSDPIFGKELQHLIKLGQISISPRATQAVDRVVTFENGEQLEVTSIIWATGFQSDFNWVDIPNVLDSRGNPNHHKGVSKIDGLYFLGLPWQNSRGSALIGGVRDDAKYLVELITSKQL
ncbi:flavin-containing monooxygenase [Brevibacillus daliensis]|uniref:flavin-containing monooxygenase n=1 Tax=Brevibacillus daliensis TaxID=2892995 RepID=UPI001E3F4E9B|nr:NAD(P)/FAD-dependent oxidoreductase [Brevibacillus daliensis]